MAFYSRQNIRILIDLLDRYLIGGAIIWFKPHLLLAGRSGNDDSDADEHLGGANGEHAEEVDAGRLERGICDMEVVVMAVHELHVWAITVGKILRACHVNIKPEADADAVLNNVIAYIQKEHSITHVTIQIER